MASGCPVAASNVGSIPEVCGNAAELFDPASPQSIAEGVRRAIAHSDDLIERGLKHCCTFTWQHCVQRHEDVYLEVADQVARRQAR